MKKHKPSFTEKTLVKTASFLLEQQSRASDMMKFPRARKVQDEFSRRSLILANNLNEAIGGKRKPYARLNQSGDLEIVH